MSAAHPRVFAMHGAAPGAAPTRFATRFVSDDREFSRYLARAPRFVGLAEALAGEGDALTVDDATRASADACLLARSYGHPVTLFVNPGQVEASQPYWFVLLNALLERLGGPEREFGGRRFPTRTFRERGALRAAIKAQVQVLKDEPARSARILELATRWQLAPLKIPHYATTLELRDLQALVSAGVSVQNHGWWHSQHASLSSAESAAEIREGREWLRSRLGVDAPYFAVPFGDGLPSPEAAGQCSAWLTLTHEFPPGPVTSHMFNRTDLTLHRAPGAFATARTRLGRSFAAMAKRLRSLRRR